MAELNIRINTQQAATGAKAFEKMINDIKAAARSLDQQNFTQFGQTFRALTSSGANLLAMVNQIADAMGRMNYSLQSIRAANYGAQMASDFTKLRDVVRETRAQLTGLNTELKEAVTLAGRMGTASQRIRRTRAPAAAGGDTAAEAAEAGATMMTTALVPATTRALTVFQAFRPVASSITLVTTAVSGLAREMRLLTSGAESADRSLRQLVTTAHRAQTAFRVDPSGGAARANEFYGVGRPPPQLGPGGMGQAGAMVPYQRPPGEPIITPQPGAGIIPIRRRGVEAEILQGEIVDRYGKSLMNVQQPLRATAKELEQTKEKKDRLDRNMKDMGDKTLPRFNAAWLVTIGYFAMFTTRRIIDELTDLGKSLFKTGEDFEKIFALFKAGAGGDIQEAQRRMQVAGDSARKYGLDLAQTADNFARVEAAAKGSNAEGAIAEEMAKNLSAAQAVFGQSTEKGIGLIKVFTDVLGKGRLQSEELVKQLGNAVPGAFRVVAQSVGKTTTELQDAVAKGSLDVVFVLSRLAAELYKIYGAEALNNVNRLGGAFNNLKTSITEVSLLIVNMSTGLMMGGGGNFGQALIASFNQLSEFLRNREIQTRIVELANFITNILAKAFQGLLVILTFVTEHMQAFIGVLTFLTSAAVVAGVVALALAFKGLFASFLIFAASPPGAIILITGLIASFLFGAKAAAVFGEATKGVADSIQQMYDRMDQQRVKAAPGNQNPADQTRAVQEALNRVMAEQRRFVEGVRQEAQMLGLAAAGVSTLSARYEAYLNVLERIKSQEIKELFQILSPQDAATMKSRLTEALLVAETVKQAIGDIIGMFKSLDQAQDEFSTKASTATETLRAIREGSFTDAGEQMQEQYDQRVLPVLRRVRDELRHIADPALRNTLVGAFNEWSHAMRDNIRDLKVMADLMGAVTDITRGLRDFRFEQQKTELFSTIDAGTEFVKQTVQAEAEDLRVLLSDGFPDLKPPKVRTLGEELKEGFNPTKTGEEMGRSFTDVFVKGMEASVQKLIDEMKKMAEAKTAQLTGTGGPYLPQAKEYKELFEKAGTQYNVDPELLARFARFESEFNPKAVARDKAGNVIPGGGQGIMQFIPSTQEKYGLRGQDVFDPEKAIMAGGRLVADLLKQHPGDLMGVVQGYRGQTFEKDPEYYNRVLGGYQGTGTISTTTQAAVAKPPAATTPESAPQLPPAFGPGPVARREAFWQFLTRNLLQGVEGVVKGGMGPMREQPLGPGMRFEAGDVGELKPTETPPALPVPAIPGVKTEERAKQTAEETQKIKDQVEAIKKRNEAEQASIAIQQAMAKEREEKKAEYEQFQKDLDLTVQGLEKQIGSLTKLGDLEATEETRRRARAAGIDEARRGQEKYNAITEDMLKQLMLIGQGKFYLQAIAQGNEFIRNIERQTKVVREETAALEESPLTREATAQARARRREAAQAGAFTPDTAVAREKTIKDAQDAAIEDSVKKHEIASEKEQRLLQMEIESLNDNTISRAANLEMRKQNDELLRNSAGLSEDQKRRILQANEALRQQRIAQQQANGPLRQYIDSLADFSSEAGISHAMQERSAELFKSLEDNIISFTKTGKLNFRELADSFIESIIRMTLQALIFRPIAEALNSALSGGGGAAPAAPAAGGAPGWFGILQGLVKIGGMVGGMGGAPTGMGFNAAGAATSGSLPTTFGQYNAMSAAGMFSGVGATGGWVTTHGIQRFQGGGMAGVGTDTVPALLTPGEMVLNKEQQANVFGKKDGQQNNTFNMVFPNVSNEDQARKTAAQAYSEISSRLERQRVRDGVRVKR